MVQLRIINTDNETRLVQAQQAVLERQASVLDQLQSNKQQPPATIFGSALAKDVDVGDGNIVFKNSFKDQCPNPIAAPPG